MNLQRDIEDNLFLRGWVSPFGLLGKNSVFEIPERTAAMNVQKSVFFPISAILNGGEVNHRVLVTSEFAGGMKDEGPRTVEIQERSKTSKDWVTQTIHTPTQFLFKLAAEDKPLLPGKGEGKGVENFMRFALDNGFTTCLSTATRLGQVVWHSRTNPANDGVLLCLAVDQNGAPAVDIRVCGNDVVGSPSILLEAFEHDRATATLQMQGRMAAARIRSAEQGSLLKRLVSWISPP